MEFIISVGNKDLAVRDYGGNGQDIVLMHGTGQNLEAMEPLANHLNQDFRVLSFDFRGHGKSTLDSTSANDYWNDIARVIQNRGISNPVLAGHSSGGYAATAYAANGGRCKAVITLDGFVLDKLDADEIGKEWNFPKEMLFEQFRYGWQASEEDFHSFIKSVYKNEYEHYNLTEEVKESIDLMLRRCFRKNKDGYGKVPSMEEIEVLSKLDRSHNIFPSVDIYGRVTVPLAFIFASNGIQMLRKNEVQRVAGSQDHFKYYEVDGDHNIHLTNHKQLASLITDFHSQLVQ